jgi:hypothetical protein
LKGTGIEREEIVVSCCVASSEVFDPCRAIGPGLRRCLIERPHTFGYWCDGL